MPSPVRVIGRVDVAEKVAEALRGAGFAADVATGGPVAVFGGTPPAEGVDVVAATSMFDPPLWLLAKGRHPLRPMVAVAERRRGRALRGAMARRNGPDACVIWPASPEELAAAVERARANASRARRWSIGDLRSALVVFGLFSFNVGGGIGALVAGVGLLLGLRSAWNVQWQAVGGVALTVIGGVGAASHLARLLH